MGRHDNIIRNEQRRNCVGREGHSRMPSPNPQNTCGLVGQTPMNPPTPRRGYRAGPVFHGPEETTLFFLNPRFYYRPYSPLQNPGIDFPGEAEKCDPPSARVMDESTSEPSSSASSMEDVTAGLRRSSKYSFYRPTTSPVEVNSCPPLL